VAGYDVATQPVQVRGSIGYCSQVGSTFSGAYAGYEVVDHGMLYGMSRQAAVAKGQELFDTFQLDGLWRRMPKNMSGGQKRRLDIVMVPCLGFVRTVLMSQVSVDGCWRLGLPGDFLPLP
jgi:ABC-2 type transport system ATP-binding protein